MMSAATVPKLYRSVIEDVINGVRDIFLDDGVDEQVLVDLKQLWYKKVEETKALLDENNKDKGASAPGASSNNTTTISLTTTITPTTRPVITQQPSVTQVTPVVTQVTQLDGPNDKSSDEDDDEDEFRDNDDDHEDNDDDQNDDENEYTGEEEEPLNSEDDVSDDDPHELFDTDNVVVCQYDKITRSRNKWKFHLKDGIMNLQGKDYVFQKAIGDAEW